MKAVKKAVSKVEEWFLGDRPMYGMVACRIVFGAIVFFYCVQRFPLALDLYGPNGVASSAFFEEVPRLNSWHQYESGAPYWWYFGAPIGDLLRGLGQLPLLIVYALITLSGLSFSIGYRTRLSGPIAALGHALLCARSPLSYWGWATMLKAFLVYVCLADTGRWFSVDAWLRKRKERGPASPAVEWLGTAWPMRLLQFHVCAMYAEAGWSRLDKPGWLNGEMLFSALTHQSYARFLIDWHPYRAFLEPFCSAVFVLEPVAPFFLWLPSVGPLCALGLIAMHFVLEVTALVGWWNFMMVAGLLNFLPSPWLRRLFLVKRRIQVALESEVPTSIA